MAGRPPTKDAPQFGQQLATLRKAKGLSQEGLAKLLNTTRDNVAYYERKASNPTLDFIQRCADALDVPVTELIHPSRQVAKRKPGPTSKLQFQLDQITRLPRSKQKFVSEFLDNLLQKTV